MQLLHSGAMPPDGERRRWSMYSKSGRQCAADHADPTVIRECARVVAAPATGSWSATRTRRIRSPRAPQQLTLEKQIMPIRRAIIGAAPLVLGLSFAFAQQTIVIPDNLFTQAGFVVKYATTPEKSAILRSLPPDKLVTRRRDGKLYYVYADAARCNCAYVGTPEAYAAYRNWANIGPGGDGGSLNAMDAVDSYVGAPYIPADIGNSMDSILHPSF